MQVILRKYLSYLQEKTRDRTADAALPKEAKRQRDKEIKLLHNSNKDEP